MNEKKSFSVHVSNLAPKSPLLLTLFHLFSTKDLFLTLIGTIVAVASLLQIPEVRCLAGLPVKEECQNNLTNIILHFFSFFCFLTTFIVSFLILFLVVESFFIMFYAAILTNRVNIVFIFKKLVSYLKNKLIRSTKFYNLARYFFTILKVFFVCFANFYFHGVYKVFIIFYYSSIIWFSFIGSLLFAASLTPQWTKIFGELLQHFFYFGK